MKCSTAKEHTNEVQSGGRHPGVSRPLCGRPLDMGKRFFSENRVEPAQLDLEAVKRRQNGPLLHAPNP